MSQPDRSTDKAFDLLAPELIRDNAGRPLGYIKPELSGRWSVFTTTQVIGEADTAAEAVRLLQIHADWHRK